MQQEVIPKPRGVAQESEFGPWLAKASILVVDDEPGIRNFLMRTLEPRCKFVDEAADTAEASRKLDERHFDIVILDNIMPKKTGLEWLTEQRAIGLYAEAILMTAYADLETAILAIRAGAADFLLKPFRSNQLLNAISRSLDRIQLQRENFALKYELKAASDHLFLRDRLVGSSATIQQTREMISRVAPLPTSVLLTGESGTGKEVLARSIHELSDRAGKPFVPINCAAIPSDMLETELFGHVKGAFTGADNRREGLFMHAQGGTLFLDEIGEMPMALQSKLLRVIEDRKVRPVGAEREVPVDIRLVFATNADLASDVDKGRFRADLYYRINVMQIYLAPLRDRERDVVELADLFMHKLSQQLGMPPVHIDNAARSMMLAYHWPGNVRELRNLIERSLILGRFPNDLRGGSPSPVASGTLDDVERRHILAVLEELGGNRDEASRRLGVSRKTIDRKLSSWHG
ncbi:Transcriptional regulatory protein ZraR [Agrobacterium sp. DSM 25558]|uniref:sigma-54-dependent transcriptional regulator n=1 Tax=Agrobacterium sp. DSM 25558 TaxID=1907665 RepID=UPI00097245A3|nr:sigma-54 dependent transcriptional regulator [Agrobacterium sp. DSM 25558]SCX09512.1 Transcriptional regulatory protein ZraR [Agrobacterium sp. DSM 25558]